jgi:hypothetical protein
MPIPLWKHPKLSGTLCQSMQREACRPGDAPPDVRRSWDIHTAKGKQRLANPAVVVQPPQPLTN